LYNNKKTDYWLKMAGPSNTVKPAEIEKLVNVDIEVTVEEFGILHFDELGSSKSQGIFD
jgi:hypothetical protein